MINIDTISASADMIVSGYAFTEIPLGIQVINLACNTACVIDYNDTVIETDMDDIELEIVLNYYKRNRVFLEE